MTDDVGSVVSISSVCDSFDSLKVVPVKQHIRRRPGGGSSKKGTRKSVAFKKNVRAKKKTHIKEEKQRAKLSNKPHMDPDMFQATMMQMDYNKENFRSEQANREINEKNVHLWNEFGNRVIHLPKQRIVKTREAVKREKAEKLQAEYIDALNNLDEPMSVDLQISYIKATNDLPMEFL